MQKTQPEQLDAIGDDEQTPTGASGDEGFDPKEVEQDPSHEPEEEGLKDLKGG